MQRKKKKPKPPHAIATKPKSPTQNINNMPAYIKKASKNPTKPVAGAPNCKLLTAAAFEVFSGSDPGSVAVGVIIVVLVLVLVLLLVSAISTLNSEQHAGHKKQEHVHTAGRRGSGGASCTGGCACACTRTIGTRAGICRASSTSRG